ncbi:hypothetical protein [Microbacterium lacticum]
MDEVTDTTAEGEPRAEGEEEVQEDVEGDDLANVPPERLAQMVRDKRRAEAAVRQKLRDVEAAHGVLETAVTGFRARQVRTAAAGAGALAEALDDVVAALSVDDILADDGTVDDAGLTAALAELRKLKPFYWPTSRLPPRSSPDSQHTGMTYAAKPATWGDVLGG